VLWESSCTRDSFEFLGFVSKMLGKRKNSKKGKTAVTSTVATSASIDPKEQIQAGVW